MIEVQVKFANSDNMQHAKNNKTKTRPKKTNNYQHFERSPPFFFSRVARRNFFEVPLSREAQRNCFAYPREAQRNFFIYSREARRKFFEVPLSREAQRIFFAYPREARRKNFTYSREARRTFF